MMCLKYLDINCLFIEHLFKSNTQLAVMQCIKYLHGLNTGGLVLTAKSQLGSYSNNGTLACDTDH